MPTTDASPDLLGITIAHRAMIGDSRRFADMLDGVARGISPCDGRRAGAIATYLGELCNSIHHHHTIEDEVMWQILIDAAGGAIDVHDLRDDHAQLDPVLDQIRSLATGFAEAPDGSRTQAAGVLANALDGLHELLAEHIAEEEKVVFPVVENYVTADQWKVVEDAARKGSSIAFEVPRIGRYITRRERVRILGEGGLPLRVMLRWFEWTGARRERRITGR
jgi:hemerythrin-like domain-containing protein